MYCLINIRIRIVLMFMVYSGNYLLLNKNKTNIYSVHYIGIKE